tara:strand:+ start:227 stop:1060 length:834 start_codon:yes stop_codon:yes gene_type:complete
MPELPEVETVRLALSKLIKNTKVIEVEILRKDLRWKIKNSLKKKLKNDILIETYRRGKYILIPTLRDNILLIHLGMSGQIKIRNKKEILLKHDHVRITIESTNKSFYYIIYNDPRRFGYIDLFNKNEIKKHFLLKNLGVDPFSKKFNKEYLSQIFKNRSKNIKNSLIDQNIIAGIGNIYASEILFKAKINPFKKVNALTDEDLKIIVKAIRSILKKSITLGGTTIKDHLQPNGKLGYFKQKLQVYGKKNKKCNICNNMLDMAYISKRSTFYCNQCQI